MSSSVELPVLREAVCGRCGGLLRVEPAPALVACPQCGTALVVPDEFVEGEALTPAESLSLPVPVEGTALESGEGDVPAVDSRAEQPGQVFVAAEHAGPPPLVGDESGRNLEAAARVAPLRRGVSRGAFFALIVYASVVTAVCLGLAYVLLTNRHQLESLPDVVPPRDEHGNVSRVLAPADAPLPRGHVLGLGETRRFGDLAVTPLRVTREALQFEHYKGAATREPAGEVLKLWLKFENMSDGGRSFVPLDGELLFYRAPSGNGGDVLRANNFLAPAGARSPERLIGIYDHPPTSDWNLKGQKLGSLVAPGESVVMFVPSETELPDLEGPLAWRLQLRKGIAENGWGVTTLVEVAFRTADVERGDDG